MTKKELDRSFALAMGGMEKIKELQRNDWYALQLSYQIFIDGCCKSHLITQKQYEKAVIPWKKLKARSRCL